MNFASNTRFSVTTPDNEIYSNERSAIFLDEVLQVFVDFVPLSEKRICHVDINPLHETPKYLDNQITILLNTAGSDFWAQNVYQFTHELCHFAIKTGIKDERFKWFEEVICDISSHFFLEKMTEEWSKSIDPRKRVYSKEFSKYSKEALLIFNKFKLSDLAVQNSSIYNDLCRDRYNRENNRNITRKLLPIFIQHPSIWQEIPKLSTISNFDSLKSFFDNWITLSTTENVSAITKIKHQFGL